MNNSKLLRILRTFSNTEWNEFEKLVSSPYFNKGRNLMPYLKALKKFRPDFTDPKISMECIYSKVHNGNPYNVNTIKSALSALVKMAEEYLLQLTCAKNYPTLQSMHALELNIRNLKFLMGDTIQKAVKSLERYGIESNVYRSEAFLDEAKIQYHFTRDRQILVCEDMKNYSDHVFLYFVSTMSKVLHNMNANMQSFNVSYKDIPSAKFLEVIDFEKFIARLDNNPDNDILKIYLCAIITRINEKDEKYYYMLKKLLFENMKRFLRDEQYFLLVMFQSLCQLKGEAVDRIKYQKEKFEIIKFGLEYDMIRTSILGYFPVIKFTSYVDLAIRLKEFKWLNSFIKEHINEVNKDFRENIRHFCSALISFEQKNFSKALTEISKRDNSVVGIKRDIYRLMLKIYYEENHVENAMHTIDTFNHFLHKDKKTSEENRESNINFLRFFKKLLSGKDKPSQINVKRLKTEIVRTVYMAERPWLLEKTDEFLKM